MADPEPETKSSLSLEGTTVPSDPPTDDIRAQKVAKLKSHIAALNAEIKTKREKLEAIKAGLKAPPAQTVKRHIALLHQYNEIRDVGQGLLGLVAEKRGCRVADLYGGGTGGEEAGEGEFGVGLRD